MKKKAVSLVMALGLILTPTFVAKAESVEFARGIDRNAERNLVVWDVAAVRPTAYAGILAGAIIYLSVAHLASVGGKDIKPLQDALLKEPYDYAVEWPFGQFD
jgi:hypothetical protein